jgi:4-hydroxy-2-oxoheptanedioate aldolase
MMENRVLKKFKTGEKTIGTFSHIDSSTVMEGLFYSGLDYVIIDTEHGPLLQEGAYKLIGAAMNSGLTPFVRIHEISRSAVLKNLDAGAMGLVVPCVETVEQVKKLVEYAKFAPIGKRGFCPTRDGGWGFEDHAKVMFEYMNTCNRETLLLPQCETVGCLNHIEEIAGMEGVDGIFVGPYDLSIDMGMPGEFENTEFKEALKRILTACKNANKLSVIFAGNEETAKKHLEDGFDSVVIGVDVPVLINSYARIVNNCRERM